MSGMLILCCGCSSIIVYNSRDTPRKHNLHEEYRNIDVIEAAR